MDPGQRSAPAWGERAAEPAERSLLTEGLQVANGYGYPI